MWVPELGRTGVHTIEGAVYDRVAHLVLHQEGLDGLVPRGYDHNVCDFCEGQLVKMSMELEKISHLRLAARKLADGAPGALAANITQAALAQARHDALEADLREHLANRTRVEKMLHAETTAASKEPWRFMKISIDDKADKEQPSVAQATGGSRKAYSHKLQGVHDDGKGRSYLTTTELGVGSKDCSLEMTLTLLVSTQRLKLQTIYRLCASFLAHESTVRAPCVDST